MLEGLVYGERAGLAAARYARKHFNRNTTLPRAVSPGKKKDHASAGALSDLAEIRDSLKKLMWEKVGILRNRKDLTAALKQLKEWGRMVKGHAPDRGLFELENMITASTLITRSALSREGSVGAHFRSDFPSKGKNWRKRTVLKK